MSNMNSFFSIIIFGYGIYCLYQWFTIRRSRTVATNGILLPRECSFEECIDGEEFLRYILPRLLVLSVLVTVAGALGIADGYWGVLGILTANLSFGLSLAISLLVLSVLPFAVVIWFAVCLHRVHKRLWVF